LVLKRQLKSQLKFKVQLKSFEFSKIGSINEDFTHLKFEYRKLIYHHCKITYREGKDKIYINRIFDTRQNPIKNK
jgi:hypothetical protein